MFYIFIFTRNCLKFEIWITYTYTFKIPFNLNFFFSDRGEKS